MSDDQAELNQLISRVHHLNVEKGIPLTVMYANGVYPAVAQGIYQYPSLTEAQKNHYHQAVVLALAKYNDRLAKLHHDIPRTRQYECINDINKVLTRSHYIFKHLGLAVPSVKMQTALRRKRYMLNRIACLEKNFNLSSQVHQYICIITQPFIEEFKTKLTMLERCLGPGKLNITCTDIDAVFAEYLSSETLISYNPDLYDKFYVESNVLHLSKSHVALASDDESEDMDGVIISPALECLQEPPTKLLKLNEIDSIYQQLHKLKYTSIIPDKSAWQELKQRLIDSLFMESLQPKLDQNMENAVKQLAILQCTKRTFQPHMQIFQRSPNASFTTVCGLIVGISALMNQQQQLHPIVHQCIFKTLPACAYHHWDNVIHHVVDELKSSVYGIELTASSYIPDNESCPGTPR